METIFFLINELSYFEYLKPQIELHWHTNVVLVMDFWSFRQRSQKIILEEQIFRWKFFESLKIFEPIVPKNHFLFDS